MELKNIIFYFSLDFYFKIRHNKLKQLNLTKGVLKMTEETFYETSFRFKWGVGFFIELLLAGLKNNPENIPEDIYYALEGSGFTYDKAEEEFLEADINLPESTPTNFVLKLDKEIFDALLEQPNGEMQDLKEQLITEYSAETGTVSPERLALLHETYDEMPLLDAILTYTDLTLTFPDEQTLLITDPNPQKVNKDFQVL